MATFRNQNATNYNLWQTLTLKGRFCIGGWLLLEQGAFTATYKIEIQIYG
jgi:hypothetical protein